MGTNPKLNVGEQAPNFELESDDRGTVSLEELRGRKVVLYFYPKDSTPGCTTQACDFRDHLSEFQEAGWEVLGVSPDPIDSHETFREDHDLNFTLLSDPDQEVAERYGVWREKTNFGNKYMGIVRSTFLIEEDGELLDIQDNVQAKGHVERVLRDLPSEGREQ